MLLYFGFTEFQKHFQVLLTEHNPSTVACLFIQSKLNERYNKKVTKQKAALKYQKRINMDRRTFMCLAHLMK